MSGGMPLIPEIAGSRVRLPCGHALTMPWGLSPAVVAAELLRHESQCDLDPGQPSVGGPPHASGPSAPSLEVDR